MALVQAQRRHRESVRPPLRLVFARQAMKPDTSPSLDELSPRPRRCPRQNPCETLVHYSSWWQVTVGLCVALVWRPASALKQFLHAVCGGAIGLDAPLRQAVGAEFFCEYELVAADETGVNSTVGDFAKARVLLTEKPRVIFHECQTDSSPTSRNITCKCGSRGLVWPLPDPQPVPQAFCDICIYVAQDEYTVEGFGRKAYVWGYLAAGK